MVIAIRMSSFECSNSSHFRVLMQSNSQTRNRPSHSARRRGRTPRAVGAASRVRLLRASARASFAQCCRCRSARVVAKIPAALFGGSHFACSPIYRSPPHSIAHSARKGVPPRGWWFSTRIFDGGVSNVSEKVATAVVPTPRPSAALKLSFA